MLSERIRSRARLAGGVLFAVFLSVVLFGAGSLPEKPRRPAVRHFRGSGSLPLSGDLGIFGTAFRDGFLEGVKSLPDSLFYWTWDWSDNEGDPLVGAKFLNSADTGALLLVGLSSAASGLPACPRECLVLDDGGTHPSDPLRWDLWTPSVRERDRLLSRLMASEPPRAVVVEATGAWTEPVFPALSDSLPGLLVLLHDPENSRWDDAIQQILQLGPRTILFWNSPSDASSLLARRLAWPVFSAAKLWVPQGTVVPEGLHADTLRPVWQAVAGDSAQIPAWKQWGWRCGQALARSSRRRVLDTLASWNDAFGAIVSEPGLDAGPSGWYPGGP